MATTASLPAYLLPGVAVHQPPHLEGDASLATEILPGPPSAASVQQMTLKRDPKKPSMAYSYLPTSDPGSTYSGLMHGTLIGQDHEGPRTKRSRVDRGAATGRAQRASARNQSGMTAASVDPLIPLDPATTSTSQLIAVDSDPGTITLEEETGFMSRSDSSLNLLDPSSSTSNGRVKRGDKVKGKDVETPPLRVKEEPKSFSLNTPEPPSNLLNNEDHCSACRSFGSLVYCDGCPRAFHLWCLDPPLEGVDDARWFCPTCLARKHPPQKPPPSLLSALIRRLQTTNPVEYQLPEEIRIFFKDVATGPKGAYVDSSELKPPRINRHGLVEDRDPYRLRDRNGGPVLCFQCGLSALPSNLPATAPAAKRARKSTKSSSPDAWKSIVSCDYCILHWHLDCLDPPLSALPSINKKWMCPNHAEKVIAPKRRVPRQHAPPIEITKPRQFNNGNIDIIHPEYVPSVPSSTVPVDEVLINGRRYRVPERAIILDFWHKLNKWDEHIPRDEDDTSGVSSPLTELSSLDGSVDFTVQSSTRHSNGELDELSAAQLLCDLSARQSEASHGRGKLRKTSDRGVQTDCDLHNPPSVAKNKVGRPRKHPLPVEPTVNGVSRPAVNRASESANTSSSVTVSAVRRRRASQHVIHETSNRELRSRSRQHNDTPVTSISSRSSLKRCEEPSKDNSPTIALVSPSTVTAQSKGKIVNVKLEEVDGPSLISSWSSQTPTVSSSGLTKVSRTVRASQAAQKVSSNSIKETKEKRGRKRKSRDDEVPCTDGENGSESMREFGKTPKEEKGGKIEKPEREAKKSVRTPARQTQLNTVSHATPPPSTITLTSPSLSITPSLKIRLPRLSNLTASNTSFSSTPHPDTPIRR
ncbi:unnamed protein product [Cyclocybe aegerita]|uniref:PHD-type domain-containing protein n=1 Tax=Cyclocybe aegerita TaxID=1973307 RepID=A0A8S0XXQ4_CYCAE|nr:unnamed protein product [Cyclocybe aegerita]